MDELVDLFLESEHDSKNNCHSLIQICPHIPNIHRDHLIFEMSCVIFAEALYRLKSDRKSRRKELEISPNDRSR